VGVLFTRHLLDSLNPLGVLEPPKSALDIGSGAGFPGVPLSIAWPSARVTLLESRERKAAFLERVAREIPLANVKVMCDRLETWAPAHAGRHGGAFDAVFIRAVGNLPDLLTSLEKVCESDARWVYFLGEERESGVVAGGRGVEVRGLFGGRLLTGVFGELEF
jgi:16S rRNA (guanine527-N7)-methyltransferase